MGNGLMQISAFDKLLSIGDYEEAYDNGDLQYVSYLNTGKLESVYIDTLSTASNLIKIDMPNVKSIYGPLFGLNGSPIYYISAPKLEYLYNSAFYKCYNLSELNISTVKSINEQVFYGCSSLKKIYLNNCINIGSGCFIGASNLEYVNLYSCKRLERYAFSNDTQITSIELPNIQYIGDNALPFNTIYAKIGLSYVSNGVNIISPQRCNSISCEIDFYKASYIDNMPLFSADYYGSYTLNIKASMATSINSNMILYDYSSRSYINLKLYLNNIISIVSYAFSYCQALKYIELNSLKYIPEGLFYRCINLEEIKLNNVISVGSNVFYHAGYNNEKLSIYLPNCTKFNATYNEVGYTDLSYIKCINLPKISILSIFQYTNANIKFPKQFIMSNCKAIHYYGYSYDIGIYRYTSIESFIIPKCSIISCKNIESSTYVKSYLDLLPCDEYISSLDITNYKSFYISAPKIKDFGPIALIRPNNLYFPECEKGYFAIRPDIPTINIDNIMSGHFIVNKIISSEISGPINNYLKKLKLLKTTSHFSITLYHYKFDYVHISDTYSVNIQNDSSIPYGSVIVNRCIPGNIDTNHVVDFHVDKVDYVELNNTDYTYASGVFMRWNIDNINKFNVPLCSYIYISNNGGQLMLYNIRCNTLSMPNLISITYNLPYTESIIWCDTLKCKTFYAPLCSNISRITIGSSDAYRSYVFRGIDMTSVKSLTIGLSSFSNLRSLHNIEYLSMSNLIFFESTATTMNNLPVNVNELHLDNCQIIKCNQYNSNIRLSFNSLTYIDLPNLISIESKMIMLLPNLSYFNAPKLEYLGAYAFSNCKYLSYLDFPKCSFIGDNALPSTIELVRFGYSGVVSLGAVNMNSSYTHIIQVPESLYSAYMSDSRYISLISQGNWLITAY